MKSFFKKTNIIQIKYIIKYEKIGYDALFNLIKENKLHLNDIDVVKIITNFKDELLNKKKLKKLYEIIDEQIIEFYVLEKKHGIKDCKQSNYLGDDKYSYHFINQNRYYSIITQFVPII